MGPVSTGRWLLRRGVLFEPWTFCFRQSLKGLNRRSGRREAERMMSGIDPGGVFWILKSHLISERAEQEIRRPGGQKEARNADVRPGVFLRRPIPAP